MFVNLGNTKLEVSLVKVFFVFANWLLTLLILAVCRAHVIHELRTGPHSWSLWLSCKAPEGGI